VVGNSWPRGRLECNRVPFLGTHGFFGVSFQGFTLLLDADRQSEVLSVLGVSGDVDCGEGSLSPPTLLSPDPSVSPAAAPERRSRGAAVKKAVHECFQYR